MALVLLLQITKQCISLILVNKDPPHFKKAYWVQNVDYRCRIGCWQSVILAKNIGIEYQFIMKLTLVTIFATLLISSTALYTTKSA